VYEWNKVQKGAEHKDTLKALNGLAASSNDNGDIAAARVLYSECFELQRKYIGDNHPDTLQTAGSTRVRHVQPSASAIVCILLFLVSLLFRHQEHFYLMSFWLPLSLQATWATCFRMRESWS
jgi:hypothetical protein